MAVLSLEFASGAFATSSVTLGSRQEMSRLRFVLRRPRGRERALALQPRPRSLDLPRRRSRRRGSASRRRWPTSRRCPSGSSGQFHRLHAALTSGGPLPVTLADARRSVELLTAAYYSAMTGEAVALPLPPDHPFYGGWLDAMKGRRPRAWLTSSCARSSSASARPR